MRTKYIDLIDQTFDFPQNEFNLREDRLFFHGIDLMRLINEYGTPLKFNYLPQISNNIQRAKGWFREAINNLGYSGNYYYSYCTKSSHFSFVLDEVLKNDVHIETSSAFDIDIVKNLYNSGKLEKGKYVICNGYKPEAYLKNVVQLIEEGLPITVIDPFNYVCTDTWCPTRIDGRDLYFDNNHLTMNAAARLESEFVEQLSSSNS